MSLEAVGYLARLCDVDQTNMSEESKWRIANHPVAKAVGARLLLVALGVAIGAVLDHAGVSQEERAEWQAAMCSELFSSSPDLSGQRLLVR